MKEPGKPIVILHYNSGCRLLTDVDPSCPMKCFIAAMNVPGGKFTLCFIGKNLKIDAVCAVLAPQEMSFEQRVALERLSHAFGWFDSPLLSREWGRTVIACDWFCEAKEANPKPEHGGVEFTMDGGAL